GELALKRERTAAGEVGRDGPLPPAYFLAVSGGGDDGAFGSGLLCGWSDAGTIPTFKLVTGVSTGAMIAPLAFLGRPYNDRLRALYTTIKPDDILETRGPPRRDIRRRVGRHHSLVSCNLPLCRRADAE